MIALGLVAETVIRYRIFIEDVERRLAGASQVDKFAELFCNRILEESKYNPIRDVVNSTLHCDTKQRDLESIMFILRQLIKEGEILNAEIKKLPRHVRRVGAAVRYTEYGIRILVQFRFIQNSEIAAVRARTFLYYLEVANEIVGLVSDKKYAEVLIVFGQELVRHDESSYKAMGRYLPILFDLAAAESAQAVSATLNKAASPIGAWRLKQETRFLGLNALVGGAVGGEEAASTGDRGVSYGMFAPIGIEYSWPAGSRRKSRGVLFSILDFGNALSYSREATESNDTVGEDSKGKPSLKIEQLQSYGIYFHQSWEDTGLVYGLGVSYVPKFRQVEGSDEKTDVKRAVLFFAFDIPIFPFNP